jgi:hypothetical protein
MFLDTDGNAVKRTDEVTCGLEMLIEGLRCRQRLVCEKLSSKVELEDVRSRYIVLRQPVNLQAVDQSLLS